MIAHKSQWSKNGEPKFILADQTGDLTQTFKFYCLSISVLSIWKRQVQEKCAFTDYLLPLSMIHVNVFVL